MMWIMKRKRSSRGSLLTPKKRAKGVSNMFRKRSSTKQKREKKKGKHTVGLEPTISCSVGKRLIQLGYACCV